MTRAEEQWLTYPPQDKGGQVKNKQIIDRGRSSVGALTLREGKGFALHQQRIPLLWFLEIYDNIITKSGKSVLML